MSEATMKLGLPLIQTEQAQKDVTHNEALVRLDRLLGCVAESRSVSAPPASPEVGSSWIVPPSAGGPWAGHEEELAEWDGAGWRYLDLPPGFTCWLADEGALCVRRAGGWTARPPVEGLTIAGRDVLAAPPSVIAEPSGGTVVDSEARATIVQLLQSLRNQGVISE